LVYQEKKKKTVFFREPKKIFQNGHAQNLKREKNLGEEMVP